MLALLIAVMSKFIDSHSNLWWLGLVITLAPSIIFISLSYAKYAWAKWSGLFLVWAYCLGATITLMQGGLHFIIPILLIMLGLTLLLITVFIDWVNRKNNPDT